MKIIILTLLFSFSILAQITPTADTQIWTDVQILYPLNKKADVFSVAAFRVGRNASHSIDERIGGGFNLKPNKFITLTPTYLYLAQQPLKNIKRYENRLTLAVNFSHSIDKLSISDRSQFEKRFLNNRPNTWRYRNRLQIERKFKSRNFDYRLYASDEIFYDSGAKDWTRNRFLVGITHKISSHYLIDFFGGRQNDGRIKPGNWNIWGLALKISLK